MQFLGIDLGTTNCSAAYAAGDDSAVAVFEIPQLIHPGEIAAEPLLESALYLAREGEFAEGALDLPWRAGGNEIAGRLAARRGADAPGRRGPTIERSPRS